MHCNVPAGQGSSKATDRDKDISGEWRLSNGRLKGGWQTFEKVLKLGGRNDWDGVSESCRVQGNGW